MRDPDRFGLCRVTAFSPTLQHFLTIAHKFSSTSLWRVAHTLSPTFQLPRRTQTMARSGQLRGRNELEDSLHDELCRNGGQQQTGDLCQQHDAAGPEETRER